MAKKTFKVTMNGQEKEVAVKSPNAAQKKQANIVYARSCRIYMEAGLFTRDSLDKHLRDEGIWDDEKEDERLNLQKLLADGERKLNMGGIKASEGREIAVEMVKARRSLAELLMEYNDYDNMTAESKANTDKFNYLVSVCTVYNDTGKPVFANHEDFEEKSDEEVAILAASSFAEIFYNIDEDFSANLPETRFLRKFKFVDKDFRFVNKDGKFVNMANELVDEEGRLVDDEGKLLVPQQNVDPQPFLDDDGNPIVD